MSEQEAVRLGKRRRSGGGPRGIGRAGGDRDGSTDDSAEGTGDGEGAVDDEEMPDAT